MSTIRITTDIPSGYPWDTLPWCRQAPWGRRATVRTPCGFVRGYLVPPDFEPLEGFPLMMVFEGEECVVETVDPEGVVWFDHLGRQLPQPSDTGSGGWTTHRGAPTKKDGSTALVDVFYTPAEFERLQAKRAAVVRAVRAELARRKMEERLNRRLRRAGYRRV